LAGTDSDDVDGLFREVEVVAFVIVLAEHDRLLHHADALPHHEEPVPRLPLRDQVVPLQVPLDLDRVDQVVEDLRLLELRQLRDDVDQRFDLLLVVVVLLH
jgi:hypothetical protein